MSRVQFRVELLPMLLEEMQSNLLHFDEDWNPFLSPDEVSEFDKKELAQARLLSLIEKVELFLTRILISRSNLFEIELEVGQTYVPEHKRPIEQSFFSFNHIFKWREISSSEQQLVNGGNCFCNTIQYGVDLNLCLKVLGGVQPKYFRIPYEHLGFKNGKFEFRGSKPSGSGFVNISRRYYPDELSTDEPTFNQKKILNKLSIQLRELLHHSDHTKLLNSINTNAIARHRRATEYLDSLFERYIVLSFVCMDLCFDHEMELARKQNILAAFKNGMRKHPVLDKMVGHLGKWEHSFIKDTYIRMIFIFPKLEQHVQDQMPEIIGALWMEYTKGNGCFHRAYLASQPSKLNQTVCTITAKNKDLRTAFEQRALYYLTHSQEYYRYKYNPFFSSNKRYKAKLFLRSENDNVVLMYREPRDIFFKGELTGEALERSLEKKRQRAEEKRQARREKTIKILDKLRELQAIEQEKTDF